MTDKTTNWTPEELAAMRRQETRDYWPAYEQDARGHKVPVKTPWQGHLCPEYEHCSLCVDEAWDCAAAIAFGIVGMAEAIRNRDPIHWRCARPMSQCLCDTHAAP